MTVMRYFSTPLERERKYGITTILDMTNGLIIVPIKKPFDLTRVKYSRLMTAKIFSIEIIWICSSPIVSGSPWYTWRILSTHVIVVSVVPVPRGYLHRTIGAL